MNLTLNVKPISYLKDNAAQIVKDLTESKEPLLITQNGESKLVVMDVKSYEKQQETFALMKLLAIGKKQAELGNIKPMNEVLDSLRK